MDDDKHVDRVRNRLVMPLQLPANAFSASNGRRQNYGNMEWTAEMAHSEAMENTARSFLLKRVTASRFFDAMPDGDNLHLAENFEGTFQANLKGQNG